jgi:2-polyprenyl-6-methoxyphenol hydroxylase-like FAD-dependent oxidoreductase
LLYKQKYGTLWLVFRSFMPQPKVLISGASLAGPATAFWLVRAGFEVTIVEQAPEFRAGGKAWIFAARRWQ